MLHRSLTVWLPGRKELEVDNSFDIFFFCTRKKRKEIAADGVVGQTEDFEDRRNNKIFIWWWKWYSTGKITIMKIEGRIAKVISLIRWEEMGCNVQMEGLASDKSRNSSSKKKKKRGTDSSECVALVMEVCRSALPLASISSIYWL